MSDGAAPLRSRVMQGLAWRSGSQVAAQLVTWSATFLIIRLLSPTDYGMFAATQPVLALLAMLGGEGLAVALIREKTLDDEAVRRVLGLLILINLGLAAIQCAAAPLVASYYRQPIVADLLRVQALAYLAAPLIAIGRAMLSRRMDFRTQAWASMAGALASAATGTIGALSGWGIWTLVAAPLAMYATRATVLTIRASIPLRPSFRLGGLGRTMRFGAAVTLSQLLWFGQTQSDVIIGGRWFEPHALGLYTTSLFLAQILTAKFMPSVNEVAYSGYARIAGDRPAVADAFAGSVRMVMTIALPFYAGMALTAGPLVAVVLGEHWTGAVPIVRGLALAMPWVTLQIMFSPVTNALGRPMHAVYGAAAGCVIMPTAYLLAASHGTQAFVQAWVFGFPLLALFTAAISLPLIGLGWRGWIDAIAPAAGATLGMVLAVRVVAALLPASGPFAILAALVLAGAISYAACLRLGWPGALERLQIPRARTKGVATA